VSSVTRSPALPEVGFYGELDPFGGGISSNLADLPRLVRELSIFLLVKDIVNISPGNLLEHALTLKAAERLAPFVRAGRLTTTSSASLTSPGAMIDARVGEYIEGLGPRRGQKVDRARRAELDAVGDRWRALLPDSWSLTRDVPAQIAGFGEGILRYCAQAPERSHVTARLRRILEESFSSGAALDRNLVLAQLASLRSGALPPELARLLFVVQSRFYAHGVESHQNCALFPGAFAQLARRIEAERRGLLMPCIDWSAHPGVVARRLGELGVDLARLLELPVEELLSITRSKEWLAIRGLIRGGSPSSEVARACASLFAAHADPTEALAKLPRVLDAAEPVPGFPARWQLGVSAILGLTGLSPMIGGEPVPRLDVARSSLVADAVGSRSLTATQLHLLTVIAGAGEEGLSSHDLVVLTTEVDIIEGAAGSGPAAWRWRRMAEELANARALRVRVLISRLNQVLEPFGLWVVSRRGLGRYRLRDRSGRPARVSLEGTLWALLGREGAPAPPRGFSATQAALWGALAASSPFPLTVQQLAAVLSKPADEQGLKQVTDSMARLRLKLDGAGVPWRIFRLERGIYALLPLRSALASEVV
jgi:hypothetical protein